MVPIAISLAFIGLSEVAATVVGELVVALGLSLLGGSVVFLGCILVLLLVVPRLSLVLPALALGQPLSPREAWRASRANTPRLALATGLCMAPAVLLLVLPSLLTLLLQAPWWLGFSLERIVDFMLVTGPVRHVLQWILESFGYAVLSSLADAALTIFAVTLLSLTYRFFVVPREESASPAP